jgi:hypothetical protein
MRFIPLGLLLTGCGGQIEGPAPVPASGTVTYKGQPVETGTIQFVPAKGRAASGAIENGKFTLSTYADGDGAVPGAHQVGISASKQGTKIVNGEPEVVFLVPEVYATPATSAIIVEVPPSGKTDIEIKID